MQHIKMATSSHYPWWLLVCDYQCSCYISSEQYTNPSLRILQDVARQMDNTRVFQLFLPGSFRRCHVVVGEPSTFHAILTDPLSTKPLEIYGRMKNMNGSGIATIFTMNGSNWHAKRKAGEGLTQEKSRSFCFQ